MKQSTKGIFTAGKNVGKLTLEVPAGLSGLSTPDQSGKLYLYPQVLLKCSVLMGVNGDVAMVYTQAKQHRQLV